MEVVTTTDEFFELLRAELLAAIRRQRSARAHRCDREPADVGDQRLREQALRPECER